MIRVKVCCIANPEEAGMAVAMGASALGLVAAMPSGPGVIEDHEILRIAAVVPPGVSSFLLTSRTDADGIAEHHFATRTQVLQLVDRVPTGELTRLRKLAPQARIVPVIHVLGPDSVEEARETAEQADALLLDSGRPDEAVKILGGTGETHDWSVSRAIVEAVDVPVFLAGGLRPDNVAGAIETVRPFGVDLCSGVRTDGGLDSRKLGRFMTAVRNA